MIRIRPAAERGSTQIGWLNARHSFSFNQYYDPEHMGFHGLRVINDDRIAPGGAFGRHGHKDMEIITWVLEGSLQHEDSTGGKAVLQAGDVQYMSAGRGIQHSEANASTSEPVHLLQIWIEPPAPGASPRFEDLKIPAPEREGKLKQVAAIADKADVFISTLPAGARVEHSLREGRHAWLQVGNGSVSLNGTELRQGDGAAVSGERSLDIIATEKADVVLFDLQ